MEMRFSTRALTGFNKDCVLFIFTQPTPNVPSIGPHSINAPWTETILIVGPFRFFGYQNISMLPSESSESFLQKTVSKSLSLSRAQLPHCNSPSSCPTPEYKAKLAFGYLFKCCSRVESIQWFPKAKMPSLMPLMGLGEGRDL